MGFKIPMSGDIGLRHYLERQETFHGALAIHPNSSHRIRTIPQVFSSWIVHFIKTSRV